MNNIIPIEIKDWIGVKLVIANPKDLEFVPENAKVIYDEIQPEGFLWAIDLQNC